MAALGGREYSCINCIYIRPRINIQGEVAFFWCARNNPDRFVDINVNLYRAQPYLSIAANENNRVLWCGEWKRRTGAPLVLAEPVPPPT